MEKREIEDAFLSYPLKHLLPTNILHPTIKVRDLLHDTLYLTLILTFNLARLSNSHVKRDLDSTYSVTS